MTDTLPPDLFLLDPRNTDFAAHKARRLYSRVTDGTLTTIASILSFLGLVTLTLVIGGWGNQYDLDQFARSGKTVVGRITHHRSVSEAQSKYVTVTHYLAYEFEAETPGSDAIQHFTREQAVDSLFELKDGDNIPIRYLPTNPAVSMIEGSQRANYTPIIAGVIFLVILLLVAGRTFQEYFRGQALEARGQVIFGQIDQIKGGVDHRGHYHVNIVYHFRCPQGSKIDNNVFRMCDQLRDKPLPSPGTPIAVVYLNAAFYRIL